MALKPAVGALRLDYSHGCLRSADKSAPAGPGSHPLLASLSSLRCRYELSLASYNFMAKCLEVEFVRTVIGIVANSEILGRSLEEWDGDVII